MANTRESSVNEIAGEKIWPANDFFQDVKSNFGMEKFNFPENTLIYINQTYLRVQRVEKIIYVDHFILGQIISAAKVPIDLDTNECASDEVKTMMLKLLLSKY